jgi:hypothetical protein
MKRQWVFAAEWMLATAAAAVLTTLTLELLFAALGYVLLLLLPLIAALLGGTFVAVSQWLLLRRWKLSESQWWLLATPAGFLGTLIVAVPIIAVLFTPNTGVDPRSVLLAFAIATPVLGIAQVAVLRRWSSNTFLWVPATMLAWLMFAMIHLFGLHALSPVSRLAANLESAIAGYAVSSAAGAGLLGGLCAGAITGLALIIVLRERLTAGGSPAARS